MRQGYQQTGSETRAETAQQHETGKSADRIRINSSNSATTTRMRQGYQQTGSETRAETAQQHETGAEEMVATFTTAAWQISYKWLKANFTISNIYSQANNIYTKFMYDNPVAKEKGRQAEIDKLVNEFTL